MKPTTVVILAVCGVLALGGGWYFGTRTEPVEQSTIPPGSLMFPGLANKLATVAKLEIAHQGKTLTIEKRPDGEWGIASMHDYPVQETKLRGLLTGLTELRLSEARTSEPSEFPRLGVEDPNGAKATSNLLTLADAAGKPVASLIIGHRRVRSEGDGAEEVYVRRPGDNQSWLARGSIEADADSAQWIDRDILDIGHARIASVNVNDNALVFGKLEGRFALLQPADHPKLEDYKVDDVHRALEMLTLLSVKQDADLHLPEAGHAVFTTNHGLAITVHVFHAPKNGGKDEDVWARFSATGPAAEKKEVDAINRRVSGWSYQVGSWKEAALVPTLDDLKAKEAKKPATSAAATPVPGASPTTPPMATPPMATPPAASHSAPAASAPKAGAPAAAPVAK
ncbi:MAG TPA: DUF4340 domain-containing protein [Rhodopila sp.]|uniref:DUF4340 domain-containing protein n=1 Tax=Rhodopila sp. TaxID=2480087 RepID=UPI002C83A4DB|nr:DUF4340 domain-containing protein [Rhodopila sp.]HVY15471.1 DUF4340 domain-containing protein [Rhodopila sp.]